MIEGGSAGGLLMGAVVNMRPDLFKAVVAEVPFVDVMNTMLDASLPLTTSEWIEWGNPNKREEFSYMIKYSPYDNVKPQAYPNMLVKISLNDSQVPYWEGREVRGEDPRDEDGQEPAARQSEHGGRPRRLVRPVRRPPRDRVHLRVHAVADGAGESGGFIGERQPRKN